ncbi:serine/threonine-protein kinase Nek3 isoform X1 [Coturnix japonica]|uniref:serine/threonine-protein kinase Nek3 isoform X1 n=1 Tax=Coturnix japonica TaxID=93934 RepID=UPI000776F1B6|nr:serine/threonine-protein kinase Nek3 isoform X1 [Coturnix japonica]
MEAYEVVKVLGEGSFGRALLVRHKASDQKYAMKEIRLPVSSSGVENSRKEAILLAKMKHPNIVAYKESFEADGHLYIVMEYCDDGDLMQKIKHQRGKLFPEDTTQRSFCHVKIYILVFERIQPFVETGSHCAGVTYDSQVLEVHFLFFQILCWFVQMCLGVKHIHDKRVLHRDIKSKNVFLTQNGKVKLGDFGSARLLAHPVSYACTYVGTPYYVPPEIWENMPYNNKSDIWSLGCILYELCTLRHPFQANSWKHLILKICKGSYSPLPSHYSYELHYLIKQIFKRNPKNRPSATTILARGCLAKLIENGFPSEVTEEFKQELKEMRKCKGTTTRPKGSVAAGGGSKKEESKPSKGESSRYSKLKSENTTKGLDECAREQRKSDEEAETLEALSGVTDLTHLHRRQWEKRTFSTIVDVLENAPLLSSSFTSEENKNGSVTNYSENKPRKQWTKETPRTLMNILSNADVSLAFKTYTIYKPASENIFRGPLCDETEASDELDGEHEDIDTDLERLEPRSDEDDTDFEEDDPDWVSELETVLKHAD